MALVFIVLGVFGCSKAAETNERVLQVSCRHRSNIGLMCARPEDPLQL